MIWPYPIGPMTAEWLMISAHSRIALATRRTVALPGSRVGLVCPTTREKTSKTKSVPRVVTDQSICSCGPIQCVSRPIWCRMRTLCFLFGAVRLISVGCLVVHPARSGTRASPVLHALIIGSDGPKLTDGYPLSFRPNEVAGSVRHEFTGFCTLLTLASPTARPKTKIYIGKFE